MQANQAEIKYQHYTSAKISVTLISTKGKRIAFSNFEFITADQDIITYLDEEIANGIGIITKGELLTSKEADPMSALRERHIAEYLKEQEGDEKDGAKAMGDTKSPTATERLNPLASSAVAK